MITSFINETTIAVKMNRGNPLNTKLGSDVVSKGVGDLFVVGYDDIGKYHRFVGKFGAPMQSLEFLPQHPTSCANRTGKLEKDQLVGVCRFEISTESSKKVSKPPKKATF